MWQMWLQNKLVRTVNEKLSGVEPKVATRMRQMNVGDTVYIEGYYNYQIIRKQ